jgi:integrase
VRSIRTLAAIVALTCVMCVIRLSCFRVSCLLKSLHHPTQSQYDDSLDVALLIGATSRDDRKKPKALQGVLPLACVPRPVEDLPFFQALTGEAGGGTFLGPQFASGASDDDPMRTEILTQSAFGPAALLWLESRRPYLSEETMRNYGCCIRRLSAFFGALKLQEIDADQVRLYQRARLAEVGAELINKECSVLMQMRKRIGMPIADYQQLKPPKESRGRPLTDGEEAAIEVAGQFNKELEPGHLFVLIAKNTGGCHKELRHLQLKNIDLEGRTIYFPRSTAKNDYRMREVPLNDDAFAAICRAIEIAVEKGSRDPEHYLFPGRRGRGGHWDPARPIGSFKKAWHKICEQAGIKGLRIHDLRHHACSGMLSDPRVTRQAAKDVLGHVSDAMLDRYCHLKREAKRVAVEALQRKKPQPVKIPSWLRKNV